MKDLLKKIKKAFGAESDEPAGEQQEKTPMMDQSIIHEPGTTKAAKESGLPPASRKRDEVIRFIIHGLHPYINEKNTGIKGIRLFILCNSREEETLLNIALYTDRPTAFQHEVLERKFSDNYIYPDPQWYFEFNLVRDQLPACQIHEGAFGMDIIKDSRLTGHFTTAKITILSGQAEQPEYLLDPTVKLKYKIGRGQHQTLPSGMMHTNDIVFFSKEDAGFEEMIGTANLTVSRYHAMILFNPQQNKYYIAADKGGTPDSGNKTKLFSENGKMTRLDIAGALHVLEDGDQVELGGSARLLFRVDAG
ncbi:MAG: hypothetical protein JWM28_3492 [Chitinophagaceae bacterium]|nr:hypothetical protein [Chitinophagaceae bacterium]